MFALLVCTVVVPRSVGGGFAGTLLREAIGTAILVLLLGAPATAPVLAVLVFAIRFGATFVVGAFESRTPRGRIVPIWTTRGVEAVAVACVAASVGESPLASHGGRLLELWVVGSALTFAFSVAGAMVADLTSRWWDELDDVDHGLPEAGLWIGRLERLLIVALVLAEKAEGVAVLATAKGLLRFGEIRAGEPDRRHALDATATTRRMVEYVLIGTMLSYLLAFAAAWAARTLLERCPGG